MRSISLLAALLVSVSTHAHHSRAMFDLDQVLELEGRISKATWRNPHVYFEMEVESDAAGTDTWVLESVSVALLARAGWTDETLQVGDWVVATINPHNDSDKKYGALIDVTEIDGTPMNPASVADLTRADTTNVQPSTDFSGTWTTADPENPDGTIGNEAVSGPAEWPLTERGRLQVQSFDAGDDPMFDCVYYGVPRLASSVYSRRFTRQPGRIEIQQEQYPITRVIHLDGAQQPADFVASPIGFSAGRIEADGTLVVETTGFSYTPWGSAAGLDSSESKRVIERYRLSDNGLRMHYSHTLIDPEFLTEPVSAEFIYSKVVDHEYVYESCDPDSARIPLDFAAEIP